MNTNTEQGLDLTIFKLGFISGWITTLLDFFYKLPINDVLKFVILLVTLLSGLILLVNHIVTLKSNLIKYRQLNKESETEDKNE